MSDKPATPLLPVRDALERIHAALEPIDGYEQLALSAAVDRILAAAVHSPFDVPGHRNSAMDGYAVAAEDVVTAGQHRLTVIGTALAGAPFNGRVTAGQAVRIMTGAVVPDGTDTVIMQEQVTRDEDIITVDTRHTAGENVRHPGEDIAAGTVVLEAGRRLTPADLGLLASLGVAEVQVVRRLRVAIFSTGDELVALGNPLGSGQIYDSNRYTIGAMLHRLGVEVIDMGLVRDQPDAIAAAFRTAAEVADVVITSGGVSVGEADFVKSTLDALGKVNFWRIAMKPGKPLAFGQLGETAFFGLPGNPVSVMATFYQIVQPVLRHLCGEEGGTPLQLKLRVTERLKKRPGRQDFQRGVLEWQDGELTVRSTGPQGSHVLSSMSRADCFIVLPAESGDVAPGELVDVQPFAGLI